MCDELGVVPAEKFVDNDLYSYMRSNTLAEFEQNEVLLRAPSNNERSTVFKEEALLLLVYKFLICFAYVVGNFQQCKQSTHMRSIEHNGDGLNDMLDACPAAL